MKWKTNSGKHYINVDYSISRQKKTSVIDVISELLSTNSPLFNLFNLYYCDVIKLKIHAHHLLGMLILRYSQL